MAQAAERQPWHLAGAYAPVLEERTLVDLPIKGRLPPDLRGTYVRNGPNPRSGFSPFWFAGEGMLHGIRLESGRAVWYKNRWIRGPYAPNTNVVEHAGRLLSLVEALLPVEVSPELETIGSFSFGASDLRSVFAHPKKCPSTGQLRFISYGREPPYLTYYLADTRGQLVHRAPIRVPAPTFMHDIGVTERYTVFWDLPVLLGDFRSTEPLRWSDNYRARLGVIPRGGQDQDVAWFEIKPCMLMHAVNAFEDGDCVVLDVVRAPRLMTAFELYRFTLDLRTGRATEERIDSRCVDLPRVHPAYEGKRYRYGYAVELRDWLMWPGAGFQSTRLRKYDMQTGACLVHDFGPDQMPGECVLAPRPSAKSDDDAWALLFVYDKSRDLTHFVVLDAARFEEPPVAIIPLQGRVPFGLHGNWIPDLI